MIELSEILPFRSTAVILTMRVSESPIVEKLKLYVPSALTVIGPCTIVPRTSYDNVSTSAALATEP